VKGSPAKTYGPGEGFQIPPKSRHGARNGDKAAKLTITYVVDKDKPLALPAQECDKRLIQYRRAEVAGATAG